MPRQARPEMGVKMGVKSTFDHWETSGVGPRQYIDNTRKTIKYEVFSSLIVMILMSKIGL